MSRAVPAIVAAALLGASGCGESAGGSPPEVKAVIAVAHPGSGPQGRLGGDLVDAARLELASPACRNGPVRIELRPVDLTGPTGADLDPERIATLARDATDRSDTVGWMAGGDSNSAAVALPILNESGISVVSPTASAVPFAAADLAFPGAPSKYFPAESSYGRAFARLVADDAMIARVAIDSLRSRGIRSLYMLDAGDTDGESFSSALKTAAERSGMAVAGSESVDLASVDWTATAAKAVASGAGAVVWGSPVGEGAVGLWTALSDSGSRLPMIAGPATSRSEIGKLENAHAGTSMFTSVTSAAADPARLEALRSRFRERFGRTPEDGALAAAEGMALLCRAIQLGARTAGPPEAGGGLRAATARRLASIRRLDGPLGRIHLTRSGNRLSAGIVEITGAGATRVIGPAE